MALLSISHCDQLYQDLQKHWLVKGMFAKFNKAASNYYLCLK